MRSPTRWCTGCGRDFTEATNHDVFALHEAFADLIALFQHFAYRDVVFEAVADDVR